MTTSCGGGGRLGDRGIEKKKKGFMDMDNRVVIAGGRRV